MKKLMILGGSVNVIPVIQKAHEMGAYVITCDYEPGNPAHKYSDEYCNASTVDKELVLSCAKRYGIGGIISFACDSGVVTAAYVAEQMGLPFQCSDESARILQDKGLFRKFLAVHSFNTPKAMRYDDKKSALNDISRFNLPIIVKPVDSAGSKGVNRVDNIRDLESAIDTAIKYSHDIAFIIEEFLSIQGFRSDTDVFTIDGKISFIAYSDQRFDTRADNPYKPAWIMWPSTMESDYQKNLTDEIQRLFDILKMKSGIYNIETCIGSDGTPYIMEISPRGGGNRIAEIQKRAFGVDLIEAEIRSALGLSLDEVNMKHGEPNGCWCELIVHPKSGEIGVFNGIEINEEVKRNHVKLIALSVEPGAEINCSPETGISMGDIFLHFENRKEMDRLISDTDAWLKLNIK